MKCRTITRTEVNIVGETILSVSFYIIYNQLVLNMPWEGITTFGIQTVLLTLDARIVAVNNTLRHV